MQPEVITALVAFAGTLIGTFGGIITSSKLITYRIEQLEKKVNEHNGYARRLPVVEEQIKVINHRLDDLEEHQS